MLYVPRDSQHHDDDIGASRCEDEGRGVSACTRPVAQAVIGLTTYGLGLKDPLAYNAASLLGTGLGTIFRFYAYRKWVFLAPAEQPAPNPTEQPDGKPAAVGNRFDKKREWVH